LDENKRKDVLKLFPADAISRALTLKKAIGSLGAYSHSQGNFNCFCFFFQSIISMTIFLIKFIITLGIPHVRENVAKFIQGSFILKKNLIQFFNILLFSIYRKRWLSFKS